MEREPGPRLAAVRVGSRASFAALVAELWAEGLAVLPVDPVAPGPEIERILGVARPDLLISGTERIALDDGIACSPDTAVVLMTSGTTGPPKAVELSHAALRSAVAATHRRLRVSTDDRWLLCVPVHHIAGFAILVRSSILAVEPEIHESFDLERLRNSEATLISLVPTQLLRALEAGVDLSGFRHVLIGGARMDERLSERAATAGVTVTRTYGMTETCGGVVYDGRPLDGVDVRIDTDGVVELRALSLFTGYRSADDLTRGVMRDGWFRTNDLGHLREGRLTITGRSDAVIVSGGEKVAPDEIEKMLAKHPGVKEVAVLSRPDDEWGEVAIAVVVPADPLPEVSDLISHAKQNLAPHKVPKEFHLIGHIPKTGPGKPDLEALRNLLAN